MGCRFSCWLWRGRRRDDVMGEGISLHSWLLVVVPLLLFPSTDRTCALSWKWVGEWSCLSESGDVGREEGW